MDIHVNGRRRDIDEKDNNRELIAEEGMPIGIHNSSINHPVFDKPLIDVEINTFRISLRKGRKACKSRNPDPPVFECNGLEMLVNFSSENGFDSNQRGFRFGVFMEGSAIVDELERNRSVRETQSEK